jgi:hypothetical protein
MAKKYVDMSMPERKNVETYFEAVQGMVRLMDEDAYFIHERRR